MSALFYVIIWAIVVLLMMRFACGAHVTRHSKTEHRKNGHLSRQDLRWVAPERDQDAVCGQSITPQKAKSSVYQGWVYYFCSRECREIFEAAPETYVRSGAHRQPPKLENRHV